VKGLGESVKVMQGNLPTLQALRNPALRERHWTKLAAIMTTPLVTDPPLTLAQLLDLKVSYAFTIFTIHHTQQTHLHTPTSV
jgi:hypothetical protein